MNKFKKRIPGLGVSLFFPILTGAAAAFLIKDDLYIYESLIKPPAAPPGAVFPVVWTALYILMGVSSYLVYETEKYEEGLFFYSLQLLVNFLWPVLFFKLREFVSAFACIVVLFILVVEMTKIFFEGSKLAAILQYPYIFWLMYAAYLNFGVIICN